MAVSSSPSVSTGRPLTVAAKFRRVVGVILARRTWAPMLYAAVGLPLAAAGFVFVVVSTALGVALAVTFVGLPLLALSGAGATAIGRVHRRLVRALLGETIAAPVRVDAGSGLFGRVQAALADPATWRARTYLVVKLPLAATTFYALFIGWVEGLIGVAYPLIWSSLGPGKTNHQPLLDIGSIVGRGAGGAGRPMAHSLTVQLGSWHADTWPRAFLIAGGGLVLIVAGSWMMRGLVRVDQRLVRVLLGPSQASQRVRQVEAARARVVDDAAARLRRIERDLHDGTQAQLVTLAMSLGQARERLATGGADPGGALELVDGAHRQAKEALVELRDIARGIHPPALDVGLDAALATLVARSAVPAELAIDLTRRPSEAIGTIAYFSVAELLTNVARHAGAHRATVTVECRDRALVIAVGDDGHGGAEPGPGHPPGRDRPPGGRRGRQPGHRQPARWSHHRHRPPAPPCLIQTSWAAERPRTPAPAVSGS